MTTIPLKKESLYMEESLTLPPLTNNHLQPHLRVLAGEIRAKSKPWSLTKTLTKILGIVSFHDADENQQIFWENGQEYPAYINDCLSLLFEKKWSALKSFASIVEATDQPTANILMDEDIHSIEELAQVFYCETIPLLRQAGWHVDIDASFPFRPIEAPGEWYADLGNAQVGTATDWFDLEMGLVIDGQRINILPLVVNMLRDSDKASLINNLTPAQDNDLIYIPMDDGRLLPVIAGKIRYIARTLIELYDADSLTDQGKLRLSAWQSSQLVEIEAAMKAAEMRWFGDEQIRHLGAKLRDFTQIEPVPQPQSLMSDLRPYQTQGVSWLQFLRENNLNGILADDMGLGKTIQTLSHILVEIESGRMVNPVLVIAPTSLMTNWRMEATRFAPRLKVLVLHGNDRHDLFEKIPHHDLVLTTYPLLARDKDFLMKYQYHILILDEAQVIKNPNTMAHRVVQQISAHHRLCLTGTPMENHLGELWSLFYFLMPGFLGDQKKFNRVFRVPIEKLGDDDRRQNLAKRVKPFMLRRTKQQVVAELPPKTEIIQNIELLPEQRALYESIRLTMHERVQQEIRDKGLKRSHIVILDALLKLRQVCCDPRLLKLPSAQNVRQSAKMQLLMDILPEMIAEKRQVLLFSQFTSMLALIEQELILQKIPFVKLTGQTKDRATVIDTFQSGQVPLFLISLKAGGTGLNLTAADTVIHYDPWWNPAVENQATDRAYRIGQDKPVFVHKFITMGTAEEKILQLQQRKSVLLSGVFDSGGSTESLFNADDLEALFEPLGS